MGFLWDELSEQVRQLLRIVDAVFGSEACGFFSEHANSVWHRCIRGHLNVAIMIADEP